MARKALSFLFGIIQSKLEKSRYKTFLAKYMYKEHFLYWFALRIISWVNLATIKRYIFPIRKYGVGKCVSFWLLCIVVPLFILLAPLSIQNTTFKNSFSTNIGLLMDSQRAYAQSDITNRLNAAPITITEDDEGVQIDWAMSEAEQDNPSDFLFDEWFWDNYSGYYLPIATLTLIVPDSQSAEELAIDILLLDDALWQNDIPLAEVEIMLSADGEELPNMQPMDLQLPTEPVFVLREGRMRGQRLIVIGVSPIYELDGDSRVVKKLSARISDATLLRDDQNGSQPNSQPIDTNQDKLSAQVLSPLDSPALPDSGTPDNDAPTVTTMGNSPLALPSVTAEAGLISPLSPRSLTLQQTAEAEPTTKPTQVATATKKPTATSKPTATKTPTSTKKPTRQPTKRPTNTATNTPTKILTSRVTVENDATKEAASTTISPLAIPDDDTKAISPLAKPDDNTQELAAIAVETVRATTIPTIISLLNTPTVEPMLDPTVDNSVENTISAAIDVKKITPTIVATETPNQIADNEIVESTPKEQTEQIWSPPRYISRTWLALPIFFAFTWGILLVITRKPT